MEDVTLADRIRAQDEMIAVLQEGEAKAGGDRNKRFDGPAECSGEDTATAAGGDPDQVTRIGGVQEKTSTLTILPRVPIKPHLAKGSYTHRKRTTSCNS